MSVACIKEHLEKKSSSNQKVGRRPVGGVSLCSCTCGGGGVGGRVSSPQLGLCGYSCLNHVD